MQRAIVKPIVSIASILLAVFAFLGLAPTAEAQITVGGHVGFVIPWVTFSGGKTTSQFDEYNIGFPVGVTFKGQGHFAVDLEMIPFVNQPRTNNLVVDPGVLYTVNPGSAVPVTLGLRAAFTVNSPQVGFIPLVHVDNPFGAASFIQQSGLFQGYFVEIDLPVQFSRPTNGPATNSVAFATHFGLGF
jgi:hypothetical protein